MGKLTPKKRKQIEELVLGVMKAMDVTGENAKRYQQQFDGMTDAQLEAWLKELASDEDRHLYLEVLPFRSEPTLNQIEAAAKLVDLQLHQYVYFKHDGSKDDPVRTRHRLPVGYIHIRRLQQILMKKTSYSMDASKRSQITGQLSGEAAIGRIADEEAYSLKTVGAEAVLKELLGPRADNKGKRLGMYQAIDTQGFVSQQDLVGDTKDQPTLMYLDTLLTAAGLRSDLVDKSDLLRVTVDKPQETR